MSKALAQAKRYSKEEIPSGDPETDVVAAMLDSDSGSSSPDHCLPCKITSSTSSTNSIDPSCVERVAAIKTVISEDPSCTKTTEVDWREPELPDKDQTHVAHNLSPDQISSLESLIKTVKEGGQLVNGDIQCGMSYLKPF